MEKIKKIRMQTQKISNYIWKFIDKRKNLIFFLIVTIIAIFIRKQFMYYQSPDFYGCVQEWFNELKENGGLSALSRNIGNYNPPYLTILALLTYIDVEPIVSIKIVSIVFDFICALTVMKIATIIFKDNKNVKLYSLISYAIVLILPTVILNSACWGQADSIYVAFILISLRYLLEKKYFRAFVYLGISFAFKLQFAFILPLYIFVYITERKFPIYYFLIIPIMNFILTLPAIIAGRPIADCFNVYITQAEGGLYYLSLNFPGIWNLFFPYISNTSNFIYSPNSGLTTAGVLITIVIYGIMTFIILHRKMKFNKQKIIEFSLWSVVIATFFLPFMHDRYLYLGDILSVVYFIYNKDKIYIPIGICGISAYCYAIYLYQCNAIQMPIVSIAYLVIVVLLTKDLYDKYLKEKEIENIKEEVLKQQ